MTNPPIPPAGGPASAAAPRSPSGSGADVPDGVEASAIPTATVTDMPGPVPEPGATESGCGPSGRSRSAPDSGRHSGGTASSTVEEVPASDPAAAGAGLGYSAGRFLLGNNAVTGAFTTDWEPVRASPDEFIDWETPTLEGELP